MKFTLAAARVNRKMTQEYVASQVGKSKITIQNYEYGKSIPDIETGKKLAALFGLTVDDIIWSPTDNIFLPSDCALSTTDKE